MFALAGLAGVEPWSYTLRELDWMASAADEAEWSRAAELGAMVAGLAGAAISPDDLNPYARARRQAERAAARKLLAHAAEVLPETLSAAEIERRWQRFQSVPST